MKPFVLPEDLPRSERRRLARLARKKTPLWRTRGPATKRRKPYVAEVGTSYLEFLVPEEQQRAAAAMIHLSGKDLGIERPDVRWIIHIHPAMAGQAIERGLASAINLRRIDTRVLGVASRRAERISLNSAPGYTAEGVARTAAHEMRHHWQYAQPRKWTHEEAESDAEAYEEDAVERLEWRELAETMDARLVRLIFW